MPRVAVDDNKRMQLRVRPEQKATLMRAAALRNTDLTDFIVQLAMREAKTVIEEAERIRLSERDSLLVLDLERCTRCDQCVRACADAHDGVTRLIREGLRFDKYLIATSCRQCRDPLCMIGCPVGSIRRRSTRTLT